MSLAAGTRLGPYEITGAIGAGGMGEVYRAHDLSLGRDVAIKILPESFAHDPERLARFEREAKTLASLNHPHIAHVYGFETSAGVPALVMELVDGSTLADRIGKGPIPLDESLYIARQIAEALEAAHEQGIIHRDLKPANIKLREDDTVKVLDFGLAKALEPAGVSSSVSLSPTITSPAMTQAGIILGTAAYMSPEQAKGKTTDKRSDVWAFGCVLYEMLTGKRAVEGEDVSDTLAAVLRGEPDWNALPAEVPVPIRTLLTGCLAKDRRLRVADMSTALFVIAHQRSLETAPMHAVTSAQRSPLWRRAVPIASVVIVGLAAGYGGWMLKPAAPRAVTRLEITLPLGHTFTLGRYWIALSPDGTRLAYTTNDRLYVRAFDRLEAVELAAGEGQPLASPRSPFFSPDGQWVGFWHASQLKKVSVSGGAPVPLCEWPQPPYGASWTGDNTILIGKGTDGIWRVSGNGGTPEQIIKVDAGQRVHGPQLLPDGRTVLFTLAQTASWDEAQIVVQSLDDGTRQTIITGGSDARYLPTGHLVYALRDTLLAVPFDARSRRIKGGPIPLDEHVARQGAAANAAAQFAVSPGGMLAYVPPVDVTVPRRTLTWVDRQGREDAIAAPPRSYASPRLAPDGTGVALTVADTVNRDIWVWAFTRGTLTRVTSIGAFASQSAWTADGSDLIFYSSDSRGIAGLFRQAANGTGTAERLLEPTGQQNDVYAISPDGSRVILRGAARGSSDVMILDLPNGRGVQLSSGHGGQPRPLVQTPAEELNAEISPDGRWLAYQSNSSGAYEVYVRPFPDVARGQWLVSTAGGTEPLWSRDSRELFFRGPKGAVMRVAIKPGSAWIASTPAHVIDATPYVLSGTSGSTPFRTYDVSLDGKRFLMMKNADPPSSTSAAARIIVVQNWFEELRRRVPTN